MNSDCEYKIINHAVSILAKICAGHKGVIVKKLTGYLWDEKEARSLLRLQSGVENDGQRPCKYCENDIASSLSHYCEVCGRKLPAV